MNTKNKTPALARFAFVVCLVAVPGILLQLHLAERAKRIKVEAEFLSYQEKTITSHSVQKDTIATLSHGIYSLEDDLLAHSKELAELRAQNTYRRGEMKRLQAKHEAEVAHLEARRAVLLTSFGDFIERHEVLSQQLREALGEGKNLSIDSIRAALVTEQEVLNVKLLARIEQLQAQALDYAQQVEALELQRSAQDARAKLNAQFTQVESSKGI